MVHRLAFGNAADTGITTVALWTMTLTTLKEDMPDVIVDKINEERRDEGEAVE
jgi:hypothetical protein